MNKENLFNKAPLFLQNLMISLFNIIVYYKRYGGLYKKHLLDFENKQNISLSRLKQEIKFQQLLQHTISNSNFYNEKYSNLKLPKSINEISLLPIINKEELRKNINEVYTLSKNKGLVSKTGGTTGKSLEVIFTKKDTQERFAMLDNFRSQFGYKLGKKTAWFSGKNLLNEKDIKKNRFWKTDYLYKVRYYSTFHINDNYLKYYLRDLIEFKPKFMIGFPSSMSEIAKYGIRNNINFPKNIIKAIFPTAETITPEIREVLTTYFHTQVYDQYASSEGAPFIFECKNHNLHLELQSGVFEVLDNDDKPANEGRLVITSFTTHGTPLIRYDIGDEIVLSDKTCNCGNNNPLVKMINGRIDDYIYSPENGKINLGNISNTLKNVQGVQKFQAIQDVLNEIIIKIVIDKNKFNDNAKSTFISNWRDRIGTKMNIKLEIVDKIKPEKSGKYRMVKNNIKHLVDIL